MAYSRLSLTSSENIAYTSYKQYEIQVEALQSKTQQETTQNRLRLHTNFADLEACTSKRCFICRVIRMALLRGCFSREYEDFRASSSLYGGFATFPTSIDNVTLFFAEIRTPSSSSLRAKIVLTKDTLTKANDFVLKSPNATDLNVFKEAEGWLQTWAVQHFECTERIAIGEPPQNLSRLLHIWNSRVF